MEVEEGECDDDLRPPGEKVVKDEKEVTAEESKTEDVIVQPIGTGTIATTDTGELKICAYIVIILGKFCFFQGTPIVEMFSPFGSVPDNSKWGVNMSGKNMT